jgi:N-acetylglutamate synthase-like GNAT family acetyltransferase
MVAAMTDAYSIRAARPADFDAVSAVLLASYTTLLVGYYDRDLLDQALPLMTKSNPTLLASGTYYVAETRTHTLAGCGGWSMERPGSGETIQGEGHIRHFATHPEWLGRRVGASLMARCLADAEPLIHQMHCYSTLNAEPFYRACGFETIGPIEVPVGRALKFPAMLMRRQLG